MINSVGNKKSAANSNKALAILSSFLSDPSGKRTTDVAAELQMNISTVSRHLNTLLDLGFLDREPSTGFYVPGQNILALAGMSLQNIPAYRYAMPELQLISNQHAIHGYMSVPKATEIVYLISSYYKSAMDLYIPLGYKHPMYCSAMGRVYLAHMRNDEAKQIIKNSDLVNYTSETKTNIEEIWKKILETRKNGYCILVNELVESKASIAVPIFDSNRKVVASISVSENSEQLNQGSRRNELIKALVNAATKISGQLGYTPK